MIILDLEWNRGYDQKPLDEILQIGAVRLDRLGGPITDVFNVYIRPVVHKKFDKGAKKLPSLRASLESELTFSGAMAAFRDWCGGDTECAAWGPGDLDTLEQNGSYWDVPIPPLRPVCDVQRAFSHQAGAEGQQIALWRAVEYCRIPDIFDYHDALSDVVYTAMVAQFLTDEALSWEPPPRLPGKGKLCDRPFPDQPQRKIGPLPDPMQVLDAPRARLRACPLCGKRSWITSWYPGNGREYLSSFCCEEHGRFLCSMTLSQPEDGLWQGRLTIPAATRERVWDYKTALCRTPHLCKGSSKKRHRRRSRCRGHRRGRP